MAERGFLGALDRDTRRALVNYGARRVYERGTTLFHEGLESDSMFVIETGRVDVFRSTKNGRDFLLGQLGPGDLVGELALLDRAPRSATVVAAAPVTGVLLTYSQVRSFMIEHPQVAFGLLADMAAKLRAANALAENRALDGGAARLAAALLSLGERWGEPHGDGGVRIRQPIKQGELGQMANLSRENVNRRIRAWEKEGWIAREGATLTLLQPEDLQRIAETTGDSD